MFILKKLQQHYLPDDGSLALEAAVPADKLVPRLSGHEDIVQLVYKVLFQGLSLLVFKGKTSKMMTRSCFNIYVGFVFSRA